MLCITALVGCGGSDDGGAPGPGSGAGNAGSSGSVAASGSGSGGAGASSGGSSGGGAGAVAGGTGGAGGSFSAGSGGTAGTAGSTAGSAGTAGMAPSGVPFVYVGSTNNQISIYKLDAASGQLSAVKSVAAGNTPSFLAFDPSYTHLYAVNEGDAKVAAFSIDGKTGDLTFLNRVDSGGDGPAHVAVDRSGKYVMVANYSGGSVRLFPIAGNGSLGAPSDTKATGKNAHMIATDPANKFAFVANLGSNTVSQYVFDATTGKLTANAVPSIATAAGAGPRHFGFHPNGKLAYLINETNDTLAAYSYDGALGQLKFIEALSTLPNGTNGANNSCAEIAFAPSGKYVYGSNRGHDSIVTFSIDTTTGKLGFIGTTPSGGQVPRHFSLSPDGKTMIVANESGNLSTFAVDGVSGALSKQKSLDVTPKPQFVGIALLAGG